LRGLSIAVITGFAGVYVLYGAQAASDMLRKSKVVLGYLAALVVLLLYRRIRLRAFIRQHLQQALYLDGIIPAQCFRCRTSLEGFTGCRCPKCATPLLREGATSDGASDGHSDGP
jgi:hypothetical protein